MDRSEVPLIALYNFESIGLILKTPSGVHYTHQTAGYACQHPRVEGAFYPLLMEAGNKALWALTQHFRGTWSHIDEKDAEIVDGILCRNGHAYLSVDRTCIEDSFEAWIHLKIGEAPAELTGFSGQTAVLIWPNSD